MRQLKKYEATDSVNLYKHLAGLGSAFIFFTNFIVLAFCLSYHAQFCNHSQPNYSRPYTFLHEVQT
jgi:hypothetical protein